MQPSRPPRSTSRILLATVALVVGPVLLPGEISRWYVAAAANAFRRLDAAQGKTYLQRAADWDPTVVAAADFWIAQLSRPDWQDSSDQFVALSKIQQLKPGRNRYAVRLAVILADRLEFGLAVEALKLAFPNGQPTSALDLNLLAYYRSLAKVELEQALRDVRQAIKQVGNEPGLADTEAWVLHAMKRDLEALPIINEAIQRLDAVVQTQTKSNPSSLDTEAVSETSLDVEIDFWGSWVDIDTQIRNSKQALGPEGWTLAVLRSHRMHIYESLNADTEAAIDRQWLKKHRVPLVDEVF